MSFTRKQQFYFRPLVKRALALHCARKVFSFAGLPYLEPEMRP